MDRTYLEIFFLCGIVLQAILLSPYLQDFIAKKRNYHFNKNERLYLLLILIGYLLLPLIYVFSTWFSWFDYHLPRWFGFPTLLLYCFGFWLFFRAYNDLGFSWTPGLEVKEGHLLVSTGLYKWLRHPGYAACLLISVVQVFMLQNWLIGPASLVPALLFFRHRIKREELQLLLHFGEEYKTYRKYTNTLIPRIEQKHLNYLITALRSRLARALRMGNK